MNNIIKNNLEFTNENRTMKMVLERLLVLFVSLSIIASCYAQGETEIIRR